MTGYKDKGYYCDGCGQTFSNLLWYMTHICKKGYKLWLGG